MAQTQEDALNSVVKGMHSDTSPHLQPDGTYRFALNAVSETAAGDLGFRTNERSNFNCADFPEGHIVIGHQYLNDDDVLLFLTDNETSIIGLLDKHCNYSTLVESDCLGFDRSKEIYTEFRVKNGCDRIVYWVDGLNPDRRINIDSLDQYKIDGAPNNATQWNCEEFNIDKVREDFDIELTRVSNGGSLPVGSLQIVLQYLDANLNPSGKSFATDPIPLVNEALGSSYDSIDGSIAGLNSSKQVTYSISGIDENYPYLEVIALMTEQGQLTAYIIEKVAVTGSNMNYTINKIPADAEEVEFDYYAGIDQIYSSKAIAQLENRLIRANVRSPYTDISTWQRLYANNVESRYVVKSLDRDDIADGAKGANYYWEHKSYMRDEIYAFGIIYQLEDGSYSPVFHIPGRSKDSVTTDGTAQDSLKPAVITNWDSDNYVVGTTVPESEVKHLPYTTGDSVERWEVWNTAYKSATVAASLTDYSSAGYMAYHESSKFYPLTVDCEGEFIYGDLAGTPIRHHRMPDVALEPHASSTEIFSLGVHFQNVVLPPGTTGFKIVRVQRDDSNKTVIDKGIALFLRQQNNGTEDIYFQPQFYNRSVGISGELSWIPDGPEGGSEFADGSDPIADHSITSTGLAFHSAKTKFAQPIIDGTHIKSELGFVFSDMTTHSESSENTLTQANAIPVGLDNTTEYNVSIDSQAYVGTNSILPAAPLSKKFVNNYQPECYALELEDGYNAIDLGARDYAVQSAAAYITSGVELKQDNYIPYISIKRQTWDVYTDLETLNYYAISKAWATTSSDTSFGGDTYVARMDFVQSIRLETDDNTYEVNSAFLSGAGHAYKHNYMNILTFWAESEINPELRHELPGEVYYPKSNVGSEATWLATLIADDGSTYTPNYYNINTDLMINNTVNLHIPVPQTFTYCSDCVYSWVNRVIWSEQSFQEEIRDHYLNFLTNNYRDIPSNRGEITNILVHKNTLVIDCTESRFILPPTSSAMQSTDGNITIGAGDFFSQPPKEFLESTVGYLGSQDPRSTDVTEHGIFSVDALQGQVFLYSQGLQVLSDLGMRNFFEENLQVEFIREYENLTGEEYPCYSNPSNPFGVGLVSGWDTRLERWMLTKRDYRFTETARNILNATSNFERITFTEDNQWRYTNVITGKSRILIPDNEPNYFEKIGWTVSYSAKDKTWVSFHSYIPTHYIDSKSKFISVNGLDNTLWEHHQKFNYQSFYGTRYPHIIEFVARKNPIETTINDSIQFHTQAKQWDPVNKQFIDKRLITFDKAIVYNDYQTSGVIDLLVKRDQIHLQRDQERWHQQALLDVNEKTYSFNEFRDLVVDRDVPLFTKDWSLNDYRDEYFIDKVINPSAINLNKDWWEQEVFRDKYLTLRLFFTTFEEIKLVTNFNRTSRAYTER